MKSSSKFKSANCCKCVFTGIANLKQRFPATAGESDNIVKCRLKKNTFATSGMDHSCMHVYYKHIALFANEITGMLEL